MSRSLGFIGSEKSSRIVSALGPTGAEGQLPVLQEGCRGPRNRAGGPKELLENVSSSQKALALDSDSHFPAWQEKKNPQKSGLWLSGK